MFTGIIQTVGKVIQRQRLGIDSQLVVEVDADFLNLVQIGDSIAVNGVCLTAITLNNNHFCADVSNETLTYTTLGELKIGSVVNLEKALTPQSHLGGHIVSGHVDGVGVVTLCYNEGRSVRLNIQAPEKLAKYIAQKGSICVDGISLTVNTITGTEFSLNIVPHTLAKTTLAAVKVGQRVNVEVDVIARYLERLLLGQEVASPYAQQVQGTQGISESLLREYGFK